MFTGIIQDIGKVAQIRRQSGNAEFVIESEKLADEIKIGDSVAVSGVCLTATSVDPRAHQFCVTAVGETLKRTTIGELAQGSRINLELALRPSDRLGGHFVQGHVDITGRCVGLLKESGSWVICFEHPPEYGRFVIEKGSIAIDGVSLTIYDVKSTQFSVSVVPHTLESTTLRDLQSGQRVNLEFDLIAKYVTKAAGFGSTEAITMNKLREYGY
jgi:riboflavin synthase